MSKTNSLGEKIIPVIMKFVNLKPVQALKDGIVATLPATLVGSVFLLLAQLPLPKFNAWVTSILGPSWTEPLFQAYGATFQIVAIITVIGIANAYAKNEGHEGLAAGIIALIVFIITINNYTTSKEGELVTGIIPKTWTGGEGMVAAIIIGLVVGAVYSWFLNKNITIKMPDGVPKGVVDAFAALIPAAVIITGAVVVFSVFRYALSTTLIEWIYKVIQTPLQGLSDSYGGVLVMTFLISFLWWFGVHGNSIIQGVMSGILLANSTFNQGIIDKGLELTIENGAKIVTGQTNQMFIAQTGSGVTIGLVICMLFLAKSQQSKQLGRLALGPGLFNINEPILFGTPIVMNPFMFIPFILAPMVSVSIGHFAIASGIVTPFSAVTVPWTTPPIISGFILGGWKMALVQLVTVVASFLIYYPFFKRIDAMNYANEQAVSEKAQV